jgi:hypothetical protein
MAKEITTKKKKKDKEKDPLAPDPETLHKTDPQEEMEGPVSSLVQNLKEEVEKGNQESKEEADRRKDENT